MSMVNPLARARGHGSARGGTGHWFAQRASAMILVPLAAWLIYAIITLAGAEYDTARAFVAAPWNAGAFILLVLSLLYHAMLGLQVVIEDYVHTPWLEMSLLLAVRGGALLGMVMGVIFVLKATLGL
jgi:succinate dehydrogenase / fumarate reductase membrane anchor subunit